MNPRSTQEQIGLFPFTATTPNAEHIAAIRAQASATRDAAIALMLRRSLTTVWQALVAVGTAVVTWPQRRAAYASLRALSDRELEDIGLVRGDIARVFDPDFRVPADPANGNQLAGSRVQAA